MKCCTIFCILLCVFATVCNSNSNLQAGPDPWHLKDLEPVKIDETRLPPDLRTPIQKGKHTETKCGFGEWCFKRLLAIILKSGQVKKNDEDGSVDISLQMRFEENQWHTLDECLKSEATLSDVMFRRAVGYVEEGIYKPTITDKIVMAWTDYIQVNLTEYKTYMTWLFGISAALGILMWLWNHVSHKHIIVLTFGVLYIYEVFISYKEAEHQEYEKFVTAMNTCKWYFWQPDCTVPSPDPILFMKHMNPLKIAIRMFTSLICEPILIINSTVKVILENITDGLWYPLDNIVYGLLIVVINISLIYLLIMVIFNFIFNIPFSLNFLFGLISIGVKQNRRSLFSTGSNEHPAPRDTDRISGDRLDKILNVCTLALSNNIQNKTTNINKQVTQNPKPLKLQRSASTGRLPVLSSEMNNYEKPTPNDSLRKRYLHGRGEGDH